MLGAIAGDIIGSVFERRPARSPDFPLFSARSVFTDDTVLTVATAHALVDGVPYDEVYHRYGNAYPHAGYGGTFRKWLRSADRRPYGSWGNSSAMRVSPVGLAAPSAEWAVAEAARSAAVTHDHPEGIKGAEAVACAGSVPEAIVAFLDAHDPEDAIRLAISLGGDADTQAAIAGGIAEAFWGGLPAHIAEPVETSLDAQLLAVVRVFRARYPVDRRG